jgi:hypothetical protein
MSGTVFINYRREDTAGMAGRLFDRLEQEFSEDQLFFDVDNIPPGQDFVAYLNEKVETCDVLLAVVGPDWQGQLDTKEYTEAGEQTEDFVRIEIEAALRQGKTVIPVLVRDLPTPLQPFARRNAVRLSHERFKADAAGITNALKTAIAEAAERKAAAEAEAARLRAEQERKAKAERESEEEAKKDAARHEATVAGLSPEQIAKAEELANWDFIKNREDIHKLRDHLARFPNGATASMAAEKLEAFLWRDLGEAPTIKALTSFLEEFPEGAHAADAQERLDELQKAEAEERETKEREQKELAAWEAVKDTTDPETLQAFLTEWSDSPHRAEALRLKKALTGGVLTRRRVLVGAGLVALAATLITATTIVILAQDGPLHTFKGQSWVRSVAFAPDGKTALSGGSDDTLKLWDVATGELLRTFTGMSDDPGKAGNAYSVAFSPDGRRALSGGDNTLKLWDVATGKAIRTFEGHEDGVYSVAFAPDGKTALSTSYDETFKLWDVAKGKLIRTFWKGHEADVISVAFAPDGKTALSGSRDKTLKLWDVATGEVIRTFKGHEAGVFSVAFAPDGKTALSASYDKTFKLWDVATGEVIRTLEGDEIEFHDPVAFSPDGRTALSEGSNNTLKLWDMATGKAIRTFKGHEADVISVAFAPDGKTALSGSQDNTLKLWDTDVSTLAQLVRPFLSFWRALMGPDEVSVGS